MYRKGTFLRYMIIQTEHYSAFLDLGYITSLYEPNACWPLKPFYCHQCQCILLLIVCEADTREMARQHKHIYINCWCFRQRSIRSRKPQQYASCEPWSMPWRNPIKCRILLNVNPGHRNYSQYYSHSFRGQIVRILNSYPWGLVVLFLRSLSVSKKCKSYYLVTVDQKGQLEKERTLESSAWLRLIMCSNDFTLETIALSFSSGSSNSPF